MIIAPSSLVIVENEQEVARTAAESFGVCAHDAVETRGVFHVALSGGSTPKAVYATLAMPLYRDVLRWEHVRFFFGDERCVPPDHPDSNYHTASELLFTPLGIPAAHIFRMRGEDDPPAAARAYAETLTRELGDPPVFDLLFLGMGADGHTASLFPGTQPDDGTKALVQSRIAPPGNVVTNRLTITPRVINAARKTIVTVTGEKKAEALSHALNDTYDPVRYPIQIVRQTQGKLTFLLDEAAAAGLTSLLPSGKHPPHTA